MPQLTKIFAPSIQDPLHLQGVQKVKNHDNLVKNDDEVIGSVSAKSDIDFVKQEEMTQVPTLLGFIYSTKIKNMVLN